MAVPGQCVSAVGPSVKAGGCSTVARVSPLRLTYVLLVKPSLLATGAMSGQCVSTVGAFGEGGVML